MGKPRLIEMDSIKGFAILLVVVGHLVARELPEGDLWYGWLKEFIYKFHMPLFMFVSGLIYGYTYRAVNTVREYSKFAGNKIRRLAPAYLVFGLLVFIGKYGAANYLNLHVDNQVTDFSQLITIITAPGRSFCVFLWYIYTLLAFYLIEPIIRRIFRGHLVYFLPFALAVYFVEAPLDFGLNYLGEYAFVFTLGIIAGERYDLVAQFFRRTGILFFAAFVVTIPFAVLYNFPKLGMGLVSIGAMFYVGRFPWFHNNKILTLFGKETFVIYLLNTIMIGLAKAIMIKFLPWNNFGFTLMAPVLLAAGTFLPVLIKRHIISHSRVLQAVIP